MLPTILVTIIGLIFKITSSSPVYNLQPAYITATIGSTGRNIRNLPCVSRKTNKNGVCMFAIDCLKANGTHLGTCIDRFYFGSCCHVESPNDIIENTIDAALIPSREPPNRISTISINASNPTTTPGLISSASTTIRPTTKSEEDKPTTLHKLTTLGKVEDEVTTVKTPKPAPTKPHKPLIKVTSTTKKPVVTTVKRKIPQKSPITTSKPTKPTKIIPTSNSTTSKPASSIEGLIKEDNSTNLFELNTLPLNNTPVTFSVAGNTATNEIEQEKPTEITLQKPPKPTSTNRPFLSTSKLPSSTNPTKISIIENMTKPTKITIPPNTTKFTFLNFTRPVNPSNLEDSKVTIITNNPSVITQTTNNSLFSLSTKEAVISTTNKVSVTDTMKPSPEDFSTGSDSSSPFTLDMVQTTPGNPTTVARPSGITLMPAATRPAEKDPDLETNTFPAFVTWSQVVDNTGGTTSVNNNASEDNTVTEEWVPMSTPDGWVLLPSLTTINDFATPISTTSKPTTSEFTSFTSEKLDVSSESPLFSTLGQSTENTVTTSGSFENISTSSVSSVLNASTSRPVDPSSNNPVNMSDFTDVCGRRMFPEARIVGGEKSSFGRWPWQISLRQWRTSTYLHKCGAALLNENWAVTAAHCVDNVPPSDLLLRLGEHDLSTESEPYLHQERRVQIVASHPQFDPRTFEYDLALLRFYEPVQFQPNIIPVCVPQNDENFVGRTAYVTGWGRLYEDGPLPSILQEVSVPVINNTVCESMYRSAGYIEHIPNIFICAGWRRGGFDSCEGDSGGPMVIQRPDKRFLLAGVISWGIGCAEPNQPGVYTRISEFRDWINQILQF